MPHSCLVNSISQTYNAVAFYVTVTCARCRGKNKNLAKNSKIIHKGIQLYEERG